MDTLDLVGWVTIDNQSGTVAMAVSTAENWAGSEEGGHVATFRFMAVAWNWRHRRSRRMCCC